MSDAQPDRRETFLFVPGAWLGAWSWHAVAGILAARGHRVVTLTPPGLEWGDDRRGLRLEDAVAAIADRIEALDLRGVRLVTHSWGGVPATAAAHRVLDRIAEIVYVSAAVPRRGVALADENPQNRPFLEQVAEASPDNSIPPSVDILGPALMPEEPESIQRLVLSLATPMPAAYMLDAPDAGPIADASVRVRYFLSRGETPMSLARPGEEFAARAGAEPVLFDGDHMYLVTRPEPIADELER